MYLPAAAVIDVPEGDVVDDVGLGCIELESEVTAAVVGNVLKGDVEDVEDVERLVCVGVEVDRLVTAAVERAPLLLVTMVLEVENSTLRSWLTKLAAIGAPPRDGVPPNLFSQQVVFKSSPLRGQ